MENQNLGQREGYNPPPINTNRPRPTPPAPIIKQLNSDYIHKWGTKTGSLLIAEANVFLKQIPKAHNIAKLLDELSHDLELLLKEIIKEP